MNIVTLPLPVRWLLAAIALAVAAGCAQPPPRQPAPAGAVSVTHADPAGFAEAREQTPHESPAARRAWLDALCQHLAERVAEALPEGERAELHITDLRRAGAFEPWRGGSAGAVRVVRDLYPPRIDLEYRRLAADGRVLAQGRGTLRDSAFLMRPDRYPGDPLRHEKTLIDDWVAREFAPGRAR